MDAAADRDLKLQGASGSLFEELRTRLPLLLFKQPAGDGRPRRVHRWAQTRHVSRIFTLIEPFQEWPQLLDPHLQELVAQLADAFLEYLLTHGASYAAPLPARLASHGSCEPLPREVCRILYVLCKVRGVKVVSRFLNNEPKYLEPMLRAFAQWDHQLQRQDGREPGPGDVHGARGPMTWQERYVMLLWLSHLLLAPFPLKTLSTETITLPYGNLDQLPALAASADLPAAALPILSIGLEYVSSPGKDREAASLLLARLALRVDMQKLGLLGQLHQWALTILSGNGNGSGNREDDTSAAPDSNVYRCIGVLSFVYRLCALGQAHDLAPLLLPTFTAVSRLAERSTAGSDIVRTSSSARKIVIKILRSVVTLALTLQSTGSLQLSADVTSDILENAINYFMASLGDADTPVRFAASKALSLTALRLEPEMAADVIEAVVGLLDENILYETEDGQLITPGEARSGGYAAVKRNVSAVDPLQWQGLVLTLAHLLLYRSTPVALLPDVFRSLVAALKFEQRSSTGTSVGAGVRDAANFGIWALSRKYSTAELSALHITAPELASQDDTPVLQTLAVQLVCTACLDPSGNIRRGSSAALQELIGRHPDTIVQGIPLVQTVDYHSVARRAKALVDVALAAAQLDGVYWGPLLDGLMEWRGIYSPDVESRRLAARAIGQLALQAGSGGLLRTLRKLRRRLSHTSADSIEGRHGLYLAIAAVVEAHIALGVTEESESPQVMDLWQVFGHRDGPSEEALTESVLRPDLTAEAACKLISALSHAATAARVHPTADSLNQAMQTIVLSVVRTDTSATEAAAQAASDLFELLDDRTRAETIKTWVQDLTAVQKMDTSRGVAAALAAVYKHTHGIQDAKTAISEALLRCTGSQEDITNRVAAVKCIATGCLPCMDDVECLIPYLATYLNDYTTDRRGDIGSLLRSQALAAVESIIDLETSPPIESLHPLIARLAAEKLDKVRHRAWLCLQRIWQGNAAFPALQRTYEHFSDVTSAEYFSQVWRLSVVPSLRRQVLKGIATSMSLGSETVIRASRYAILESLRAVDDTARAQQASDLLADVVRELYSSMSDDRFAIPLVELTAFLLDNVNDIADESLLDDIFVAVQKSHLKSTSISRIEAAVKVYAALLRRSSTQGKAIKKLRNMLLHPYPSVRNHVADRLYLEIPAACLKDTNWSAAPKQLKPALAGMELRPVTC